MLPCSVPDARAEAVSYHTAALPEGFLSEAASWSHSVEAAQQREVGEDCRFLSFCPSTSSEWCRHCFHPTAS